MITLPLAIAAVTAGLIGGVHCVGMCGGISSLLSQAPTRATPQKNSKFIAIKSQPEAPLEDGFNIKKYRHQIVLQSGRLLTYMIIGALFGALGTLGLQFKPYFPVQKILFIAGNLALVLLGVRLLGLLPSIPLVRKISSSIQQLVYSFMPAIEYGKRHPFLMGMSWGCLPCGLLWGIAPFALLTGDALSGAIIMLLFGLAALPHLLLAQHLIRRASQGRYTQYLGKAAACILILIGIFGLWYFDMENMPDFLCVTSPN
ncbi:MAG: sulfite exporter TauE/SafE family protein [Cytophaga sp.]|nr:sulfite exporter TauE/SafE family protein [Undibacterium sp.]